MPSKFRRTNLAGIYEVFAKQQGNKKLKILKKKFGIDKIWKALLEPPRPRTEFPAVTKTKCQNAGRKNETIFVQRPRLGAGRSSN